MQYWQYLLSRLLHLLGSVLSLAAGLILSQARRLALARPEPEPAPAVPPGAPPEWLERTRSPGPPAHWVERVREAAPQLLDPALRERAKGAFSPAIGREPRQQPPRRQTGSRRVPATGQSKSARPKQAGPSRQDESAEAPVVAESAPPEPHESAPPPPEETALPGQETALFRVRQVPPGQPPRFGPAESESFAAGDFSRARELRAAPAPALAPRPAPQAASILPNDPAGDGVTPPVAEQPGTDGRRPARHSGKKESAPHSAPYPPPEQAPGPTAQWPSPTFPRPARPGPRSTTGPQEAGREAAEMRLPAPLPPLNRRRPAGERPASVSGGKASAPAGGARLEDERWPSLPATAAPPPALSVDELMRVWAHRRRLDREQKGRLWNE